MPKISLTDLPRVLREQEVIASYYAVWSACVAGSFPAEREGRRWVIDTKDIPTIVSHFAGLR